MKIVTKDGGGQGEMIVVRRFQLTSQILASFGWWNVGEDDSLTEKATVGRLVEDASHEDELKMVY